MSRIAFDAFGLANKFAYAACRFGGTAGAISLESIGLGTSPVNGPAISVFSTTAGLPCLRLMKSANASVSP